MDTDRDTLHPNTDMECSGHQVTFQFQLGLVRDKVTADTVDLNLKSLKSMACDFVAEKCPANGITRMQERVLLFKHDYHSTNILQVSQPTTVAPRPHFSQGKDLHRNSSKSSYSAVLPDELCTAWKGRGNF